MKIAHVSQPFEHVAPPQQGGSVAIWTDRVVHAMAVDGRDDVTIYARRSPGQVEAEEYEGIHYRRVPTRRNDRISRGLRAFDAALGFPFRTRPFYARDLCDRSYILSVGERLRQDRADIVHLYNFSQFAPVVRRFSPSSKIVLHMTCEWLSQLDERLIDERLQSVDLVIGCSDYIVEKIRRRFPQHADRCAAVYNGVDLEWFHDRPQPTDREPGAPARLLYVGRISPEKGIHTLLEAARLLAARGLDFHLDLVGPEGSAYYPYIVSVSDEPTVRALARFYSPYLRRDRYAAAIAELKSGPLAGRVTMPGGVEHQAIADWYGRADMVINPSLSEAFGMSLVEAMASGVPVIATSVGGMVEIVEEGATGFKVPPDDPQALAAAILKLLEDPDARRRMGRAGIERVAGMYTWAHVAASLRSEYEKLLSRSAPRPLIAVP